MDNEPSKSKPDYKLGFSLYLQNWRACDIAPKIGCTDMALRKQMSREGWPELRKKALAACNVKALTMAQQAEVFRQALAADLLVTAQQLPDLRRSNTNGGIRDRQETVNAIINGAEKLFAWGTSPAATSMLINIENLNSCTLADPVTGPQQVQPGDVFVYHDAKGQPHECDFYTFIKHYPQQAQFYIPPQVVIDVQPIQPEPNGVHVNGEVPGNDEAA